MPRFPMGLKALSVSIAVVVAALVLSPPASAAPVASTHESQQWAYGAHTNLSSTWTNGSGTYTMQGFFGWDVLLTQTNTSETTFELTANRAMALDFALSFCKNPCGSTSAVANVTYRAWETENGSANFTTNGTVYENGVAQPALALVNESDLIRGGVSEGWAATLHLLLTQRGVSGALAVSAQAHLAVAFSPALGLVPSAVSTGDVWNSSSVYAASGAWSAAAQYARTPWNQTYLSGSQGLNGSASGSGPVLLAGTDTGSVVLANGAATDGIALAIVGPFAVREGFLLVPSAADPFGGGQEAWASYSNGTARATTATLDLAARLPHAGFLASATAYAPQPASTSALGPVALSGPVPASSDGSAVVQGQPETVSGSQSGMTCLVAGNCPSQNVSGGGTVRSPLVGAVVIVGVSLVICVLVALLVVERRRVPPPRHPNAALYPPTTVPAQEPGTRRRGTAPPPEVEDPLGHLW